MVCWDGLRKGHIFHEIFNHPVGLGIRITGCRIQTLVHSEQLASTAIVSTCKIIFLGGSLVMVIQNRLLDTMIKNLWISPMPKVMTNMYKFV